MTKQIAVRLPEHLVQFVDQCVSEGARSRASVIERALERELRRQMALRDVAIIDALGGDPYPELDALARWAADQPLDID